MFRPRSSVDVHCPRSNNIHQPAVRTAAILFAVLSAFWISQLSVKVHAASNPDKPTATPRTCHVDEPPFDAVNDGQALAKYKQWVSWLLKEEQFDVLECIANAARKDETRFSGGEWKIHKFYVGLGEPSPDMHATDDDWKQHLAIAQKWVEAKPNSVTARIALARSYTGYAWFARGEGMADSVSDSGWKQFESRLAEAQKILKEASSLTEKDPEWYVVMQQVAMGQGWQPERAKALFEKAVAFEPGYYYYHRMLANFLLPKWYGQEGDTSNFLNASADKYPGAEGDAMYFLIASEVVCTCDEPEFNKLLWPRLQKGFQVTEKEYGPSMRNLNYYALMAARFSDVEAAHQAFHRIGNNWDYDTWHSERYFEQNKQWADSNYERKDVLRGHMTEAVANSKTPQGAHYEKVVEQMFAGFVPKCRDTAKSAHDKFNIYLQVGDQGDFKSISFMEDAPHQMVACLLTQMMTPRASNPIPLPVPPSAPYWVKVEIDPSVARASAH